MEFYLISLLRAVMNNVTPQKPPKDIDWEWLYDFAQKHSVTNIACYGIEALDEEDKPATEIFNKFKKAKQLVIGREMMQQHEVQGMLDACEKEKIECVALKGWWMKHLYPSVEMRSMCDIDVLVNNKDMKQMPKLMASVGFRQSECGVSHDAYMKSSILSVEVHRELFDKDSPYSKYFENIMSKTVVVEGKEYIKKMNDEDFYLHLLAHAAKHFDACGTGLRTILDIWVYNKKYESSFDKDYLEKGLRELGLYDFNIVLKELAVAWFDEGISDEERAVHAEVGRYILSAGTYGVQTNNVISNMSGESSKAVYLFKRVFPNRTFMIGEFPVLRKNPWLLPICWVVRGYRILFVRRHKFVAEINIVKKTDDNNMDIMTNIKKLSGLEK